MELVFATHNNNKSLEIANMVGDDWTIKTLSDIGFEEEVPETGNTLEENALQKVRYVHDILKQNCFADDTGLEVDELGGEPGVMSARYAGPGKNSIKNMQKVLEQMKGVTRRKARFRTVIALILDGKELLFEGVVQGNILCSPTGEWGFGYDPVFSPEGYDVSFAEMPLSEKNKISHRGRAVRKLVTYLKNYKHE